MMQNGSERYSMFLAGSRTVFFEAKLYRRESMIAMDHPRTS